MMNQSRCSADERFLAQFEAFFRENYERLWKYVARRVPSPNVDDVVASTLTVAWKKYSRIENPSLPWLIRIASYEVSNQRRANRRLAHNVTTVSLEDVEQLRMDDEFDGTEVAAAVGRLSKVDQEILGLIHWDGFSRSEVAEALALTVNAVSVRHHRALQRLMTQLAPTSIKVDEPRDEQRPNPSSVKGAPS